MVYTIVVRADTAGTISDTATATYVNQSEVPPVNLAAHPDGQHRGDAPDARVRHHQHQRQRRRLAPAGPPQRQCSYQPGIDHDPRSDPRGRHPSSFNRPRRCRRSPTPWSSRRPGRLTAARWRRPHAQQRGADPRPARREYAPNVVLEGLTISGFNGFGVVLDTKSGNDLVASDNIGTNANGTAVLRQTPSAGSSYCRRATRSEGTTAQDANVISGNAYGVYLDGSGATGNLVAGNLIGTDASGTNILGTNADKVDGIEIDGASGNTIGMPATSLGTAPGNLIEGSRRASTSSTRRRTTSFRAMQSGPTASARRTTRARSSAASSWPPPPATTSRTTTSQATPARAS